MHHCVLLTIHHCVLFDHADNQQEVVAKENSAKERRNNKRWDFIVPRNVNDELRDSLKDNGKGVKGTKKELRKLKKQIASRQRRLNALHQVQKSFMYDGHGASQCPPSPYHMMHLNKQLRQKAKKVGFWHCC